MSKVLDLINTMAVDRATGEKLLLDNNKYLCIDSADVAPESMKKYKSFNPFNYNKYLTYPVPKMNDFFSHSIESIWQGLKIIENKTDFNLFKVQPYKRPSMVERENKDFYYENTQFLYGDQIIDLLEARFLIYCPVYLYNLEKICPKELINTIGDAINQNKVVIFYDWDDNFQIEDVSSPFSHSSLLAAWFNGSLETTLLNKAKNYLSNSFYQEFEKIYFQYTQRYTQFHERGRCLG
ncbi:TPA: hypothetical protein QC448_004596 [Bacillus cereus]|uniref:DUF6939 family protein n=1 Tax=Bacillus TaxID=1386 RepID=UPI000BF40190|nr:hypothetical protein [Bacillus thuringiensis]PFU70400.1 hypothetical protein COK95_09900 [Bacillus thuringiensis]RAS90260.1 hypothetical protein A6E21_26135 [Bacillus cereus]HDR8128709.1 hypothetical protein [Bacillus cereus]HDR8493504.1 hypothetical protein [Bacillus cereus]